MGTLALFWTAMVVVTAVTAALVMRPGERETAAPAPTPTALPSREPIRPRGVPATAAYVPGALTLGDATPPPGTPLDEQDIFYFLTCDGQLLSISTTREVVYARVDCLKYWLFYDVVAPFIGQPVEIDSRPAEGTIAVTTARGGTARFTTDAVWLDQD